MKVNQKHFAIGDKITAGKLTGTIVGIVPASNGINDHRPFSNFIDIRFKDQIKLNSIGHHRASSNGALLILDKNGRLNRCSSKNAILSEP